MRPKLINKAIKYNDYDGKQKLKNEPRTGAQDSGTPRTGEQTGEPCYAAKEILNLEEAATFLGIAKSTLYKMTHLNQLPYFKPSGKLIFFEKKKLIEWVRGAKSMSVEEIKEEAAAKIMEMNERQ